MNSLNPNALAALIVMALLFPLGLSPTGARAAATCFQELPDTAWQEGQPQSVLKSLNSDLMLNSFKVSTPPKYDLSGVIPLYRPDYLAFPEKRKITSYPKTLVDIKYPDVSDGTLRLASLESPDSFFQLNLRDVRVGAPASRELPLTVQYTYIGKNCGDRVVRISRSMGIQSVETYELQSMDDARLQDYLESFGKYSNIVELRKDLDRLRMIGIWMGQTKANPFKVIISKNYKAPSSLTWRLSNPSLTAIKSIEGFRQVLYKEFSGPLSYIDSTDGCLTTSNGEKNVHLIYSKSFFAGKKTTCPIYLHIFFPGFYSENLPPSAINDLSAPKSQIVIKAWVTSADTKALEKGLPETQGFCFNGKSFKALKSYMDKCPSGFVNAITGL